MSDRRREKEALEIQVDLMFHLKGELKKDTFEEFKIYVETLNVVQPFYLEKCTTFEKLFRELSQRQTIKLGEYGFLINWLTKRDKFALAGKVEDYEDKINHIFGQASTRKTQQRSVQPADDESLVSINPPSSPNAPSRSTEIPNQGGRSKKQAIASVPTNELRSLDIGENTQRRDLDRRDISPPPESSSSQPSGATVLPHKLHSGSFEGGTTLTQPSRASPISYQQHTGTFRGGTTSTQPSGAGSLLAELPSGSSRRGLDTSSQPSEAIPIPEKLPTGHFEGVNNSAQPSNINSFSEKLQTGSFDRVGGEENSFAQPSDTSSSSENTGQFIERGESNSEQPSDTTGSSDNKLQTGNFDNGESNSAQPLEAGSSSDRRHTVTFEREQSTSTQPSGAGSSSNKLQTGNFDRGESTSAQPSAEAGLSSNKLQTGNFEREQSTSTQPSGAGSSSDKLHTGNFERLESTSAQPSEAVSFSDKLQTGIFEGVPVESTPTQPTSSNPYSDKLNTGSFEGGSTSTRSSGITFLSVKQQTGHLGGGESTSSQSLPRNAHTNKPKHGNIRGDENTLSIPSCYDLTADPRGLCIIINNIKFKQSEGEEPLFKDRPGSEYDQEKLDVLFTKLKFDVRAEKNLTALELMRTVQKVAYNVDHTNYGCLVFCILSHGAEGRVYGTDGRPVIIRSITEHFNGINCDTLRGKPKIFFIQACQGDVSQEGVETDSDIQVPEPKNLIPNESDFLIGYSTPPGYVSFRNTKHGSWYITKLVEKIEKYNNREDLQSILTMVNEEVSKCDVKLKSEGDADLPSCRIGKQSAMHVSLLRKKVFWET